MHTCFKTRLGECVGASALANFFDRCPGFSSGGQSLPTWPAPIETKALSRHLRATEPNTVHPQCNRKHHARATTHSVLSSYIAERRFSDFEVFGQRRQSFGSRRFRTRRIRTKFYHEFLSKLYRKWKIWRKCRKVRAWKRSGFIFQCSCEFRVFFFHSTLHSRLFHSKVLPRYFPLVVHVLLPSTSFAQCRAQESVRDGSRRERTSGLRSAERYLSLAWLRGHLVSAQER